MMTTGTQNEYYNATEPVLFMAFELSEKTWKLGFTIGHGQTPRERTIVARDPKRLFEEVAYAKARFGLGHTAPVVSCPGALAPSMVSWHADAAASLTPQAPGRRRG